MQMGIHFFAFPAFRGILWERRFQGTHLLPEKGLLALTSGDFDSAFCSTRRPKRLTLTLTTGGTSAGTPNIQYLTGQVPGAKHNPSPFPQSPTTHTQHTTTHSQAHNTQHTTTKPLPRLQQPTTTPHTAHHHVHDIRSSCRQSRRLGVAPHHAEPPQARRRRAALGQAPHMPRRHTAGGPAPPAAAQSALHLGTTGFLDQVPARGHGRDL